jgi:hypothetical protein
MSFAAFQRHVAVLEQAGLVTKRRSLSPLRASPPRSHGQLARELDSVATLCQQRVERIVSMTKLSGTLVSGTAQSVTVACDQVPRRRSCVMSSGTHRASPGRRAQPAGMGEGVGNRPADRPPWHGTMGSHPE